MAHSRRSIRLVSAGAIVLLCSAISPVTASALPADTETVVVHAAPRATQTVRGDIVRGIAITRAHLSGATRSSNATVTATVWWNRALSREGNSNKFTLRLVGFASNGSVVTASAKKYSKAPGFPQTLKWKLSSATKSQLVSATSVVLAASQQVNGKTRYSKGYAAVASLKGSSTGKKCGSRLIQKGANLANCNFSGVSFGKQDLDKANLRGANLVGAEMIGTHISAAAFADSTLTGVSSQGLVGQPASLPVGWSVVDGQFVQGSAKSCSQGGACSVGDTGPGGGVVFYAASSPQSWGTYEEMAPASWSGNPTDANDVWGTDGGGCNTINVTGANATAVGSGSSNTAAIMALCNASQAPAAWITHNYTGGGFTDWFLPSKAEFNQMCRLAAGQAFDASATTCSGTSTPLFALDNSPYWTSTQTGTMTAWDQNTQTGSAVVSGTKNWQMGIRPVRAFGPTS